MLWFDVAGGDKAAIALMDNVKRPWTLCENLGATESIITACAVMTHANMVREDRLKVCHHSMRLLSGALLMSL